MHHVSRKRNKTLPQSNLTERRDLVLRAQSGDAAALLAYRKLNNGLFEKIVQQYAGYMLAKDMDDLRQEGEIGYLKGITEYDPTKNKRAPEGYIFAWVRAYISNYARGHGVAAHTITISSCTKDDKGREHDLYDNVTELPWKEKLATPEALYEEHQSVGLYHLAASCLLPKEKEVARRRIFQDEGDTLEEIGADMGVSRERVRQIELEVKRKMRYRLQKMAVSA